MRRSLKLPACASVASAPISTVQSARYRIRVLRRCKGRAGRVRPVAVARTGSASAQPVARPDALERRELETVEVRNIPAQDSASLLRREGEWNRPRRPRQGRGAARHRLVVDTPLFRQSRAAKKSFTVFWFLLASVGAIEPTATTLSSPSTVMPYP